METNHRELEAHLKEVFGKLFKRSSFTKATGSINEAIQKNILKVMDSSYYDYDQSGDLRWAIRNTDANFKESSTKFVLGFASLDDMNKNTKRKRQRAVFFDGTDYRMETTLRAERSLPSWIIAEFGRRAGEGASASGIPEDFVVEYAPRQSKPYLFGPSDSKHFKNTVFFMTTKPRIRRAFQSEKAEFRTHPGIMAGHIFSKGLEKSKPEIKMLFAKAIRASLDEFM